MPISTKLYEGLRPQPFDPYFSLPYAKTYYYISLIRNTIIGL